MKLDNEAIFENPGSNDFRLDVGSGEAELDVLIDEGETVAGILEDYYRGPRPLDGDGENSAEVDIGAHEAPEAE